MNSLRKTFVVWFSICLVAGLLRQAPAGAADGNNTGGGPKVIRVVLRFPASMLGRGAATVWDDLLVMAAAIEHEEGVRLIILRRNSWANVIETLENGGADFAVISPYFLAKLKIRDTTGNQPEPVAVYKSETTTMSRYCVYMMPDFDDPDQANYKLDSLYGKRISVPDEAAWALLNQIFRESNFKFEPYYFFRSFRVLNRESSALALIFKELDAMVMDELSMSYIQQIDPRIEGVKALKCSSPLPNMLVVSRQDLPQEINSGVKSFLFSMNEDPLYKNAPPYFENTAGQWVPVSETDLKLWDAIARTAAGSGWDKSFMTIPPVE